MRGNPSQLRELANEKHHEYLLKRKSAESSEGWDRIFQERQACALKSESLGLQVKAIMIEKNQQERANLIKLIHTAKNVLLKKNRLRNDDDYRQLLASATESSLGAADGKNSCSGMDKRELEAVMRALRAKGFRMQYVKNGIKSRALADYEMDSKIRALWLDLHAKKFVRDGSESALAAWIKREFKCEALQWLTQEQQGAAIERLKRWLARGADKALT